MAAHPLVNGHGALIRCLRAPQDVLGGILVDQVVVFEEVPVRGLSLNDSRFDHAL